jgi:acyl carrier protein
MSIREDLKDMELPNDSLEIIDMIMMLEDKYDIVIPDSISMDFHTKEDIISYLEKVIKDKNG